METERGLQARLGGKPALQRLVEVAPWHPVPEQRTLQVSIDPARADGMRPLASPTPVEVREDPRRRPLAVQDGRQWREVTSIEDRWSFEFWWRPTPGPPGLLPGQRRRRTAPHALPGRRSPAVVTGRQPERRGTGRDELRRTARQELPLLRPGRFARARAAGPGAVAGHTRAGPDRYQPLRRAGVRPFGQQPGDSADHGRRVEANGRFPRHAVVRISRGLRQPLTAVHAGQHGRPPRAAARSGPSARARRGTGAARRRTAWGPVTGGADGRAGGGAQAAEPLPRLVRRGLGLRRTAAELPARRYRAQPRAGRAGPRDRRAAGRVQRRALPRARALPPAAGAGRGPLQHDPGPGPARDPAQSPPAPEVGGADVGAVLGVARGALEHAAGRGAVPLQPRSRPRLHPARTDRARGLHAGELPQAALLRGGCAALRLGHAAGRAAAGGGVPADRPAQPGRLPPALPGDRAAGAADHGGTRSGRARDAAGEAAAGTRARVVGGAAGRLPDRDQPCRSLEVGADPGALPAGRHDLPAGHRPRFPARAAGRTDRAGA